MATIGWIGVGRMGFPMADRLLAAGNELRIWNRTKSKAQPLADRGATLANEVGDLADVDVLFTMSGVNEGVVSRVSAIGFPPIYQTHKRPRM